MADLARIFKAYDIRGVVPDELDEGAAEAIGAAFATLTGASSVVIVHDMRTSSGPLAAAFGRGVTAAGADVIDGGLGSTDMLYYASGALGVPGAMLTASHNPARYNGIKLCRAGAKPVGQDTGLAELQEMARAGTYHRAKEPGRIRREDLVSGYAAYLKSLVDLTGIRPLKVAVDAGNGMAGHTVPQVFDGLPITTVPLYFELDGTFPNHEANPIDPANLADLQQAVLDHRADLGLAFDGDADRCFVVDERARIVSPSVLTALIAARELVREPGAMITASHNPPKYNGIKLCRTGAKPVGADTGLRELRAIAEQGVTPQHGPAGNVTVRDLLPDYASYLKSLVDVSGIRPLKVAVDAGNGMAGHTVPEVFAGLPVTVVPLYFELDGTFPNHEANPIDPANLVDLQQAVLEHG
ncbi:MAG TPA: hypothetical protein VF843_10975, partial [Streptosporangiaceae bacterium]